MRGQADDPLPRSEFMREYLGAWDDVDWSEQRRRARVLADAHRRRRIAWSLMTHPKADVIADTMPTEYRRWGREQCTAKHGHGYICARLIGHTGRHAAGSTVRVTAVWSDGAR
ncbi:hypothetical protein [Cellulomonas oligotrophica]|uniref:Uncharacterized protein n=1 Tax=Cellulomonas oligotrophica TaxID=931536 RepID=A0A7Y9JYG0_9CELL|nr:hypothetical protein [Cellulomonas oligotrophica]NYD87798.1 hypothetical protein [Cellulomonas oligotrophica]GIG32997.1 hypothetical protein Col01nite_21560 [Cellulomonas oligotrophica]